MKMHQSPANMSLEKQLYHYNNGQYQVYIFIDKQHNMWIKAKEVAEFLCYNNILRAYLQVNVEDLIQLSVLSPDQIFNWDLHTIFMTENGLYQLLSSCKNIETLNFRQWITKQVLPHVRQLMYEYSYQERQHHGPITENIPGHVYVATSESYRQQGIYKIGSTSNITSQLEQLNYGRDIGDSMYCIFSKEFPDRFRAEREIHILLDQYRRCKCRDFFKVNDLNIITFCISNHV